MMNRRTAEVPLPPDRAESEGSAKAYQRGTNRVDLVRELRAPLPRDVVCGSVARTLTRATPQRDRRSAQDITALHPPAHGSRPDHSRPTKGRRRLVDRAGEAPPSR